MFDIQIPSLVWELFIVFLVLSFVFMIGVMVGVTKGVKDLNRILNELWMLRGKRAEKDEELKKIEEVIQAIRKGSE